MNTNIRRITTTDAVRNEIAKKFGCSKTLISYALNYKRESGLSKAIRLEALRLGGEDLVTLPTRECWEDTGVVMRQYYPNDVEIVVNKEVNEITLYKKGECIGSVVDATLRDLLNTQRVAEKVSREL